MDNGYPWGSWGDLPTDLALWVLGLGVEVIWNRPRRPEENGVVERAQGVTQQWIEPGRCADAAQLRDRLAWAVAFQRGAYPAIDGQSRLTAYPELSTPPRAYAPEREDELWDLRFVDQFLARGVWSRRADRTGQISLYNRGYMAGPGCKGRDVSVRFDPESRAWLILDLSGQEVRRHPAVQLSRERIMALDVTHRRTPISTAAGVQPCAGASGV